MALKEIRHDPHRVAPVTIALALYVAGLFIVYTEEMVWSFLYGEWGQYVRMITTTEEERSHSLLMLSLGAGLFLSGIRVLLDPSGFWSRIISMDNLQLSKRTQ